MLAPCLAFALALRACVGLFGYSGEGTPPMFGDFEAQRHWMEITINLPPTSWYVHGADNDLLYWGLDYPPLSAHLSYLLGKLAIAAGHPGLVALYASRGHETPPTRAFMRNTVLACDALVFMTAAVSFASAVSAAKGSRRLAIISQLVLVPALVLVDHGHFQYNCVSLGLTLWAARLALGGGRPLACCVAFSLALNFKQMSLYLAPAFFCYLLAGCFKAAEPPPKSHRRLRLATLVAIARLGVVVIATFAVCWAPFLGSAADALAVLKRVFPVERHLYEDKVANIWCTLALVPFLKLKQLLSVTALLRVALGATILGLLPPCALLLWRPSRGGFLLCAVSCGLAFFLCSFQVHEKHILLPLLPASLLAHRSPALFAWFATAACFSLFPLLKRDGLALPYGILQIGYLAFSLLPTVWGESEASSPPPAEFGAAAPSNGLPIRSLPRGLAALMALSLMGMVALHALEALVTPPPRYPDLHAVLFSAYSCAHFVLAYMACVGLQWKAAVANGGRDEHTPMDGEASTFDLTVLHRDEAVGVEPMTTRQKDKKA